MSLAFSIPSADPVPKEDLLDIDVEKQEKKAPTRTIRKYLSTSNLLTLVVLFATCSIFALIVKIVTGYRSNSPGNDLEAHEDKDVVFQLSLGSCTYGSGEDQDEGIIQLSDQNLDTEKKKLQCLSQCKEVDYYYTACEALSGDENPGCFVHTNKVEYGSGRAKDSCWIRMTFDNVFIMENRKRDWLKHYAEAPIGYQLASIQSRAELMYILTTYGNERFWIGGRPKLSNEDKWQGEWEWVDGSEFDFSIWENGGSLLDATKESRIELGLGYNAVLGTMKNKALYRKTMELPSAEAESRPQHDWIQVGSDIDGKSSWERIGSSIALSAENEPTLAIGGDQVLRLYKRNETMEWDIVKDFSDIVGFGSRAQVALSSDGNHLIFGDQFSDTRGIDSGIVRVFFNEDKLGWLQKGNRQLGENQYDGFGGDVDISDNGKRIAVGARGGDYVHIYDFKDDSDWVLRKKLTGDYGFRQAEFGSSLSLSATGNIVIVGAPSANLEAGEVFVFELETFAEMNRFSGNSGFDQSSSDRIRLGSSVALSNNGSYLAVGAYMSDLVRIFKFDSEIGIFVQLPNDIIGASGTWFGYSVSLSGDGKRLGVGAPRNKDMGNRSGKTFIFENNNESWESVGDIIGEASSDEAGTSIFLSGNGKHLAVGAWSNDGGAIFSGHVRVFKTQERNQ